MPRHSCSLYTLTQLTAVVLFSMGPPARGDGSRLAYLDAFCNPYYVGRDFPRLATEQWVGEEGVEAVVVLAIDDMRSTEKYEHYLRPILDRLKKIDGRAPVSIMTCRVDPADPRLAGWLDEGLSIEVHTVDHPCPILQGSDFAKAKSTYDRCVDRMAAIPGNHPVAFRTPCCDSRNTPSPRLYAEIFNKTTEQGNFLRIDTSVFNVLTPRDEQLPRELVLEEGRPRFRKYLPFESFVNTIEDYPFPYVIARLGWQFPCVVPSDWEAQHLHKPNNPRTVADMQAALDAVVVKHGTYNLVFHPHGWIRNDQIVELIDHATEKHGRKVKFLNFQEAHARLVRHLLAGQPLRNERGRDNGVRLLDLNDDGYLDVVIGNGQLQQTRLWVPEKRRWHDTKFPVRVVSPQKQGDARDAGVRFGILNGDVVMLVANENKRAAWRFEGWAWKPQEELLAGLSLEGEPLPTSRAGRDSGVRLRDLDGDGSCELLVGNANQSAVFRWNPREARWSRLNFALPAGTSIVDAQGRDAGLRFVDVDEDGYDDVIFSDDQRFSLHLFDSIEKGWSRKVLAGGRGDPDTIPMIVRGGTNNGAWFHSRHMWVQNEDTFRLPELVDRRSFDDWTAQLPPRPRTPKASQAAIEVPPDCLVELVAAEPLVADPVDFDWGSDGRLWVVEMAGYPLGVDDRGTPGGRVRFLTDADGDGQYDKSTIFLEGLNFPTGIMAWRDGVLVTAAPEIIYAEDTDGDGRADRRETLYSGFGEGNQQHRVNHLRWGLDHWVYLANGDSGGVIQSAKTGKRVDIRGRDLRIRPDEGALEAQSGQTQFGRNRDDWGNWFGINNPVPGWHYALRDHYLKRNPHVAAPDPRSHLSGDRQIFPISRLLMHWEGYRPPPPGGQHRLTSACGLMVYRDRLLGERFAGAMFFAEPAHNLIPCRRLVPRGNTFRSERLEEQSGREFLASRDPWFRPNTIRTGPDGALWFADIYREVIEHPKWIDDAREKQLDLRSGHKRGRIYRVRPAGKPLRSVPRFDRLSVAGLVQLLESPNGTQRDRAQRMLLGRGDSAAIALLNKLAKESANPLARLHALCTLEGLEALTAEHLLAALRDEHPGVRRHAVRLCEPLLPQSEDFGRAMLELLADEDTGVRQQLAYSLGFWPDARAGGALARLALAGDADRYRIAAVLSSLNPSNIASFIEELLKAKTRQNEPRWADLLRGAAVSAGNGELAQIAGVLSSEGTKLSRRSRFVALVALQDVLRERKLAVDEIADGAVSRQLHDWLSRANDVAYDAKAALEERTAAVELLGRTADEKTVAQLSGLLSPEHPPEVQAAAITRLASLPPEAASESLLSAWQRLSPTMRLHAVDEWMTRPRWLPLLLLAVEKGDVSRAVFDARRRQALLKHRGAAIRKRAKQLFGEPDAPAGAVLAQMQQVLELSGDVERGRAVFRKRCANCHRLEGAGHEVGPDLLSLRDRSAKTILTSLLDPNRAVEQKYLQYLALTEEGRALSGILVAETATSITLAGPDGKRHVIRRSDLDQFKSTGKSLMPEGLQKDLSEQDLADLVAYVQSVKAEKAPAGK